MSASQKPTDEKVKSEPNVQGEGDYDAARRFDKDEQNFVKRADVDKLARQAAPKSKEEAEDLKKAEEIGRSHRAKSNGSADGTTK